MSRAAPRLAAAVGLAVVALGGCGEGEPSGAGDSPVVEVTEAWARATVPAATTGVVYLVLDASAPDALVGATVEPSVAGAVTLHETVTVAATGEAPGADAADMVTMTDRERLAIPADAPVALEPGGPHLMLTGLTAPLVAGDVFEITLEFDVAPDQRIVVDVRDGP